MCSPACRSKASAEMGAPHCKLAQRDGSGRGSADGAQMRSTPTSHAVARLPPPLEKAQHVTDASWPCETQDAGLKAVPNLQIGL